MDSSFITDVQSDLHPELERKFGEIHCRAEDKRLYFRFKTEEHAICGEVAINEYLKSRDIRGRTLNRESRTVILFLGDTQEAGIE